MNASSNVTSKILSVLPQEVICVMPHCGGSLLLLFFYLRLTNNDKINKHFQQKVQDSSIQFHEKCKRQIAACKRTFILVLSLDVLILIMFTRRSTNSGVGKHESEGRAERSDMIHDYTVYMSFC